MTVPSLIVNLFKIISIGIRAQYRYIHYWSYHSLIESLDNRLIKLELPENTGMSKILLNSHQIGLLVDLTRLPFKAMKLQAEAISKILNQDKQDS